MGFGASLCMVVPGGTTPAIVVSSRFSTESLKLWTEIFFFWEKPMNRDSESERIGGFYDLLVWSAIEWMEWKIKIELLFEVLGSKDLGFMYLES